MEFSSIKAGDMIRVTTAAHTARRTLGGPVVDVPEKTVTVRVDAITDVNGQPGRRQAHCTVFVTADGEDLTAQAAGSLARPIITIYSSGSKAPQTFTLAA